MLAIPLAAALLHEHRSRQHHFREEHLVLVHVLDGLVERAAGHRRRSPREQRADARHDAGLAQPGFEQSRRRVGATRRHAEPAQPVPLQHGSVRIPADPVFRVAVHHDGIRMFVQQADLPRELVRQEDVVRIEECEQLAACLRDAEIARGALAAVGVFRVLEITDAVRPATRIVAGQGRTAIGRAVVDQQQFPLRIGLRHDAVDRFGQETDAVEKRHHDRHERRCGRHPRNRRTTERRTRRSRSSCRYRRGERSANCSRLSAFHTGAALTPRRSR